LNLTGIAGIAFKPPLTKPPLERVKRQLETAAKIIMTKEYPMFGWKNLSIRVKLPAAFAAVHGWRRFNTSRLGKSKKKLFNTGQPIAEI
jgi:hypothetical protein